MTKGNGVNFELDELLHPAQAFDHPSEVVNDPDLTLNEKRAILASWASDACAIEAAPELRTGPKPRSASTTSWMRCARSINRRTAAAIAIRSACATGGAGRETTTTTKAGRFNRSPP